MKIDLHCHTKYSGDKDLEPEELKWGASSIQVLGICWYTV
jgi:predicted metal-dependent phosphoesterase TrpH